MNGIRRDLPLTSAGLLALLGLVALACEGELHGITGDGGPSTLPPCMPALASSPAELTVAPEGIAVIRATGGSGHPRFAIVAGGSTGSRVDATTGVVVGGPRPGDETIAITDAACAGSASAILHVSEVLALAPATADVVPGTAIDFTVQGGSGSYDLTLARDTSGATVSASGHYVAGTHEGDDLVRVTDRVTRASADATVRVRATSMLVPETPLLLLPAGSTHVLTTTGGSGVLDVTSSTAAVTEAGGVLAGAAPGRAQLTLRDRFTMAMATMTVEVMAPVSAPSTRVGDRSELDLLAHGDFDEDGHVDVLVALLGSNVAAYRAGAVFVLRGTAIGLDATPARTLTGTLRDDQTGSSIAVADLDGDHHLDLVLGGWQSDATGGNVGAVWIYRGVPGRFFEDEPVQSLFGVIGSDRFGVAVATCDFDGDGWLDLAVGAADAEDRAQMPRRDQQGAVLVFPSYDGTLLDRADQTIYGVVPDGMGGFESHNDLRFGSALAAGDFDGDGLCDLAVQSQRPDAMTANDGAVAIHRGRAAVAPATHGGLEALPSFVVAATESTDRGSRLGQSLALGDLDGDGKADLALSQHLHDTMAAPDVGAARVFRGRTLAGPATSALAPSAADWSIEGGARSEYVGHAVRIADATGDGHADLVVGSSRVTPMGSMATRPGSIRIYQGASGALPGTTATREVEGPANDERFAQVIDVAGDLNGDATPDLVALAPFADVEGIDVGRAYVVTGPSAIAPIDLPAVASGRRLGQSVDLVGDVDGDGLGDLLVGAPHQPDPSGMARGIDYGAAYVYRGTASAFSTTPDWTLAGYSLGGTSGHSESDWLGESVARAGDFDGDGHADLAVVARFEDQPASFDAASFVTVGDCGTAARSDVGMVLVYRGVASGGAAPTQPAFVIVGPDASRTTQLVVGGLDYDGDGRDDLVLGGLNWLEPGGERRGGYALVRGRAADAGGLTTVICAPDFLRDGNAKDDELGTSAAALGDLDGDGCDEIAVGAPRADSPTGETPTITDEGNVYVAFGFGAACASTTPSIVRFRPGDRAMLAGFALAGGVDLDGDDLGDLVIGAPAYTNDLGTIGRVYVLSGARILAQHAATGLVRLDGATIVDGRTAGERFGTAVAVLAGAGPSGRAVIAASAIYANLSGVPNSGAARLFTLADPAHPFALVSGETMRPYADFGGSLALARVGTDPRLVIGATWGSGSSTGGMPAIQEGTAYTGSLAP
ncbi:MAG: FG-GAP-like repeat-containing protein [Sandaracinus sp.]